MKFLEWTRLKQRQPNQNWFSVQDVKGLLQLENFQTIKIDRKILLPVYIPVLNFLFNTILANLPPFHLLDLIGIITARPLPDEAIESSVSIVIPARNESGNIENAVKRIPAFGLHQEIIFIEGHSSDNTCEEM